MALQLVKDKKDVEATRIKARVELFNGDFVTLSPAVKLLEISEIIRRHTAGATAFEQGDQIVIYR